MTQIKTRPEKLIETAIETLIETIGLICDSRKPVLQAKLSAVLGVYEQYAIRYIDIAHDINDLIQQQQHLFDDAVDFPQISTIEVCEYLEHARSNLDKRFVELLRSTDPEANDAGVFEDVEHRLELELAWLTAIDLKLVVHINDYRDAIERARELCRHGNAAEAANTAAETIAFMKARFAS